MNRDLREFFAELKGFNSNPDMMLESCTSAEAVVLWEELNKAAVHCSTFIDSDDLISLRERVLGGGDSDGDVSR